MADKTIENSKHDELIDTFDRRAKSSKVTLITLIYTLIIIIAFVFAGVFYVNITDSSPLGKIVNAAVEANNKNDSETLASIATSLEKNIYQNPTIGMSPLEIARYTQECVYGQCNPQSNTVNAIVQRTEKIKNLASSITSVLLSLSLMIFIGFVMKGILIFIRYYMQLVADYENQKIAYILSDGDSVNFEKYLSSLRKNNIDFEKTPTLPQEKIITSLIDLLKSKRDDIR